MSFDSILKSIKSKLFYRGILLFPSPLEFFPSEGKIIDYFDYLSRFKFISNKMTKSLALLFVLVVFVTGSEYEKMDLN